MIPMLEEISHSEPAQKFKGIELLFLGCHGGEAHAETELVKGIRAVGVKVDEVNVCDVCITKTAFQRIVALDCYGAFIFHPMHVLEHLHCLRTVGGRKSRCIVVVSLQQIPFEDYEDLLVYHRLMSALSAEDMVHGEILWALDGIVKKESFQAYARFLMETFTERLVGESCQTDTVSGQTV